MKSLSTHFTLSRFSNELAWKSLEKRMITDHYWKSSLFVTIVIYVID